MSLTNPLCVIYPLCIYMNLSTCMLYCTRAGLTPVALLAPATGPHHQKGPHDPKKIISFNRMQTKIILHERHPGLHRQK